MNLSQLQYFKRLAEIQHYSKAAKELYISQPTLSSSISALEKELGVALFRREGKGVFLTECGKVFYEAVRVALRELDEGIAAVKNRRDALDGTISLGAIFTVQDDYLPQLLKEFLRETGDSVLVKTYQNFTNSLISQLHEGSIDLAFCGKRDNEPDIVYIPVTRYDLRLCVRRDHPLAKSSCVSIEDMNRYAVYSYGRGTPIGEQVADVLAHYGIEGVVQVYQEDVAMGSFISFGDDPNVGALMLDSVGMKLFPNLVALPIAEIPSGFYTVYLAYHAKHSRSRAAERLIDFVETRSVER